MVLPTKALVEFKLKTIQFQLLQFSRLLTTQINSKIIAQYEARLASEIVILKTGLDAVKS